MSLTPYMMPAWKLREYLKQRDEKITALRAEVERLTGERDRQYDQNAEQIIRIAALEDENERLKKEALFTAISVLPEKDAENERLRAALVVWQNAYKTGRNEPLVQAYEHSTSLSAALEGA